MLLRVGRNKGNNVNVCVRHRVFIDRVHARTPHVFCLVGREEAEARKEELRKQREARLKELEAEEERWVVNGWVRGCFVGDVAGCGSVGESMICCIRDVICQFVRFFLCACFCSSVARTGDHALFTPPKTGRAQARTRSSCGGGGPNCCGESRAPQAHLAQGR